MYVLCTITYIIFLKYICTYIFYYRSYLDDRIKTKEGQKGRQKGWNFIICQSVL